MSKTRIAINGFGRIGRLVYRALIETGRSDLEIVAINDMADLKTNTHLLQYDSVHGPLSQRVEMQGDDSFAVGGQTTQVLQEKEPANLPWGDLGVDIVLECSGRFVERDQAAGHLEAGARKVLISAPAKGDVPTIVYGVNHTTLTAQDTVVSNASCTTNCLAPIASCMNEAFGIEHGFMTTIHSYTGDQPSVDTMHKDLHRARAAALNMIPTSTGAARAVGKVLPALEGKLDGVAIRVPTPNVSLVDFTFVASRDVSVEDVNNAAKQAANGDLNGILDTYDAPLVSSDFNHSRLSSVMAIDGTTVMEGNFVRVMAWYDNEWGFANRMLDTAGAMAAV